MILNEHFDWEKKTYLMGVLNITPDSFSGDGLMRHTNFLDEAKRVIDDYLIHGVDIIDIGGESSRPGAQTVDETEERKRVLPIIEMIRSFSDVPISIDTTKASVAYAALESGANIINDVSGLAQDQTIAEIAAQNHTPIIITHNRQGSVAKSPYIGSYYSASDIIDTVSEVISDLKTSIAKALEFGIKKEQIIIDPGIGFGKTPQQNLSIIKNLHQLKSLGFPVLVGPSRKSFIGVTLNTPLNERLEGTASATTACILNGANIVRVHDLTFMSRVVRMTDAIMHA